MQRPIAKPITRSAHRISQGAIARAIPSMLLDFARQQYIMGGVGIQPTHRAFSDLITFTRASGAGRFNESGVYEWLEADQPRIDYDPVTGECLGLLIEEQRTNLLLRSSDMSVAPWGTSVGTCATTPRAAIAPDGTMTATLLEFSGRNSNRFQSTTVTPGAAYTFSIWLRSPPGMGTQTCRIGSIAVGSFLTVTVTESWQRFSVPQTPATTPRYPMVESPSGTNRLLAWGAQLEAGSFPTSYIPTTDAQVTRAADVASVNELSPWYNPGQGTLFVEYLAPARTFTVQYPGVIGLAATATSNRMGIYNRTDNGVYAMLVRDGGVPHADFTIPGTAFTSGAVTKAAIGYSSDGAIGSVNGGAVARDTSIAIPAVDHLRIGQMDGTPLNGHIRSIRYFPKRLSNTELQSLTAN